MKSPFDLHVLGTPPAFILSQDQTLMLKWCLCPASFIWHCLLLIRVACQSFDQLACSWISLKILEFSGLHYCLFVKDQNLLLRKSCVALLLFSAATLISYHNRFRLSTTFFDFFKSFSRPENFHFRGGASYYHIAPCFVNNFLHLFFKAFTQWWKWRKKRNLNLLRFFFYFLLVVNGERGIWTLAPVARPTPLAGAPLQPLEYFSMNRTSSLPICYWRHFVTQKLLYISSMLLSIAFFIIFLIVDIVYEYCRIASSIFVFTMSAISGVFNCLYSS